MMDNNAQDQMEDDEPSFFHILIMVNRRETRVFRQIVVMQGYNVFGHRNVLNTFATHLRHKYASIEIVHTCATSLQGVIPLTCPT